eukprot:312867-Chlamydomonas_euryale.AAC.1
MGPAGHLPVSTPGACEVTDSAPSPDLGARLLLLHTRLRLSYYDVGAVLRAGSIARRPGAAVSPVRGRVELG